jgi:hypothetical protein
MGTFLSIWGLSIIINAALILPKIDTIRQDIINNVETKDYEDGDIEMFLMLLVLALVFTPILNTYLIFMSLYFLLKRNFIGNTRM